MMGFSLSHVILQSRVFEYLQLSDVLICNLEHCSPPSPLPPHVCGWQVLH